MDINKKRKKLRWEYVFIALFLAALILFVVIRGENIYVASFDNMDSNLAWEKMVKDNGLYAGDGEVPMLGGVDRNYFSSEFKLYTWIYMLLPSFAAFMTGWFLSIVMAIVFFWLVGKEIFPDFESKKGIVMLCGLMYGLLPTFPFSAFGFASLPLLLWLMIRLYRTKKPIYLLALLFYPVLSGASNFGAFICGFIIVAFVIDWIANKKPAWRLLAAVLVLTVGYALTQWRLFYNMLFSGVPTIRTAFSASETSVLDFLKNVLDAFLKGQNHSYSLHRFVVLPVCALYLVYLNVGYVRRKEAGKIVRDPFNWIVVWIVFNSVMYALDGTPAFKSFIATVLPPLAGFSFARTIWFNPFLWYFAFAIVLCRLTKKKLRAAVALLALGAVCIYPAPYNMISQNLRIIKAEVTNTAPADFTYREFYSEDMFERIKSDVGYNGEWSVAFGMHPAVLEYNGIATLDGYLSFYPKEYKAKFRELIEPELETDEANRQYFDNWGGRAYVFSDEIVYTLRNMEQTEADMKIDPEVFREMGGKYVFSRVSVRNADELGLDELGVYTDESSPYTIHVYVAE